MSPKASLDASTAAFSVIFLVVYFQRLMIHLRQKVSDIEAARRMQVISPTGRVDGSP
jgi:hypothetical protein